MAAGEDPPDGPAGDGDSSAAPAPGQDPGLTDLAAEWVNAAGERLSAGAALVLAETRLAVSAFMLMIFLAVLAGGAVLFAWGFLLLVLTELAEKIGVPELASTLVLLALHLGIAFGLWRVANAVGRSMDFENTRRLLKTAGGASAGGAEEADHES